MAQPLVRYLTTALIGAALVAAGCGPRDAGRNTSQGDSPAGASAAAPGQTAPAAAARPQGKPGGTLTMAIAKDITHLNPLVRTNSTDQAVRDMMFEPLLALDDRGNVVPRLAERWEISSDGKVYTFHLRRGVKFHNGQEMTAEDARYAIDYSQDPKNAAHGREALLSVTRVEVPDNYTLRLHLKEPSAAFLSSLTSIRPFSLIPKGSLDEATDKPTTFPAGTGPFRFVEWQPKQRVVIDRFDDYWGQKAFLDRIVFRPVEESTVRITALRTGDIDVVERAPYEWVREIRDGKVPGVSVVEASEAGYRELTFNVAAPPFDNKKLRQAFAYGIDKREILHAAYFGFGEPSEQGYPKGHTWYIDGVATHSYDPDKARALLREAGYNGQEIPFMIRQGNEELAAATTIQAQMRKLGVNIRIDTLEYGAYVDRQRRGEFAFQIGGGSQDPDPLGTYSRDVRCEHDVTKRSENQSGYCDAEVDALLVRLDTELDPAKRRDILKQVLLKLGDDLPILAIGFVPRYFAIRDRVKGFTSDGEGTFVGLYDTWVDR
jgi:peptide/nickel transport system substrate-binding protein